MIDDEEKHHQIVSLEYPSDKTLELIKLLVWLVKEINRAKKANSN